MQHCVRLTNKVWDKVSQFEFLVNVGAISIAWNAESKLTRIDWALKLFSDDFDGEVPSSVRRVVDKLKRYFNAGSPIGEIPWDFIDQSRWTPFQAEVYRSLAQIPHGETRTYGWVANRVGRRSATRAVGQALRNNPLPVLIPCHRVVSVTSLGGFMGIMDPNRPELDLKRRLQGLEQDYLNPLLPFMTGSVSLGVVH